MDSGIVGISTAAIRKLLVGGLPLIGLTYCQSCGNDIAVRESASHRVADDYFDMDLDRRKSS
jgi:hypothetical protein